jgi:hypothetical protein
MSSCALLAGELAGTTRMFGTRVRNTIGAKSFAGSKPRREYRCTLMAFGLTEPMSSV